MTNNTCHGHADFPIFKVVKAADVLEAAAALVNRVNTCRLWVQGLS